MNGNRRKAVTLADVARSARVSIMTVSNVLNDRGRVGEGARIRVRAAVAALGYAPNLSASRLAGASLSRVGVIYPAGDSAFLTTLVAAIATEAASRGLQLLLRPSTARTAAQARNVAHDLIAAGAESLLIVSPFAEMLQAHASTLDVPLAGLVTARPIAGMATVRIDNESAAFALTALLLDKGHAPIGVITGAMTHSDSVARLDGFRDALRARDLPLDPALEVTGDFGFASGIAGAEVLLQQTPPPTAIVAANDEMAAGVLWLVNSRGLRVPDDVAVCGFDDTLLATHVWPALTTVRQPITDMAAEALDALSAAFRSKSRASVERDIVLPFVVIERGST